MAGDLYLGSTLVSAYIHPDFAVKAVKAIDWDTAVARMSVGAAGADIRIAVAACASPVSDSSSYSAGSTS